MSHKAQKKDLYLVTGATGYLGKRLVDKIVQEGKQVIALTRRNHSIFSSHSRVAVLNIDITSPFQIPPEASVVLHCAGVISKDSNSIREVNVEGTRHVVNAAKERGCLLIHASSAGVVGKTTAGVINEQTPCMPANLYEETKFQAEQIVLDAVQKGLQARIIRPTTIFGIGREPEKDSLLHLVRSIKKGTYRDIGDGVHNLVHLDEVVRVMLLLAREPLPNGGLYLVNTPISFRQFARIVRRVLLGTDTEAPSIPYTLAFGIAALFTVSSFISGRRGPLTFSRLHALTSRKIFSQEYLTATTPYRPERSLEEWISLVCKQYQELNLV